MCPLDNIQPSLKMVSCSALAACVRVFHSFVCFFCLFHDTEFRPFGHETCSEFFRSHLHTIWTKRNDA